jgi:hypothetical protein
VFLDQVVDAALLQANARPGQHSPGERDVTDSQRFDHTGWEQADDMVRIVTFGWGQILPRLKQYAETGTPAPFFDF